MLVSAIFAFGLSEEAMANEPAAGRDKKLSEWAAERVKAVDERISALKAREARAIDALEKSKEVIGEITSLDDKGTALLAIGAVEIGLRALDNIKARIKDEEFLKEEIELGAREGRHMGFADSVGLGVFKRSGDGWMRYDRTMLISDGDEIKTATAGHISILFSDGTAVDLDEKTVFRVNKASSFDLVEGRAHVSIEPGHGSAAFNAAGMSFTASPSARDAAEFDVDARRDSGVTLSVADGTVSALADPDREDKPVTIRAGERASFRPDGTMVDQTPVAPDTVLPWW